MTNRQCYSSKISGEMVPVTSAERPVEIVCPKCGAKGTHSNNLKS